MATSLVLVGLYASKYFLMCAGIAMLLLLPLVVAVRMRHVQRVFRNKFEPERIYFTDFFVTLLVSLYACITGVVGLSSVLYGCLLNEATFVTIGFVLFSTPILLSILAVMLLCSANVQAIFSQGNEVVTSTQTYEG